MNIKEILKMAQQYFSLAFFQPKKYREEYQYIIRAIHEKHQLKTHYNQTFNQSRLLLRLKKVHNDNMKDITNYESVYISGEEQFWKPLFGSNILEVFYIE